MLLNWPTSESEYKLEYKNLPTELRKKIWEDNLKFRECCAENNRVQHFWYYSQTGNGSRHKESSTESTSQAANTFEDVSEFQESRLSEGNEIPLTERPMPVDNNKEKSVTPEPSKKLKSALKKNQSENNSLVSAYSGSHKDIGIQTPRWESIMRRIYESRPKKVLSEPCFSTNLVYDGASKRTYNEVSSPQKIVQQKKTPFLSYGWNDSKKDVGSKRTFNIKASSEEVYPAALHALSRRREMHKRSEESRRQRPSTAPLLSPVNHSSLWMTEYQDIFSRPQSAPFASKGVRWH
ncbi:hypothetical protein B566_EDAN010542 [Ephemera danica]|nr:hypothetical protein B566_EDAN010542 [Ephemera danica]